MLDDKVDELVEKHKKRLKLFAAIAIGLCILTGCWKLGPDSWPEEFAEGVIKANTGIVVEFSPDSPKCEKAENTHPEQDQENSQKEQQK